MCWLIQPGVLLQPALVGIRGDVDDQQDCGGAAQGVSCFDTGSASTFARPPVRARHRRVHRQEPTACGGWPGCRACSASPSPADVLDVRKRPADAVEASRGGLAQ